MTLSYVTSATSAKDLRKLLVLGCFLAVFPKRQKDLASLTYLRASVLYGGLGSHVSLNNRGLWSIWLALCP
jgi:hypothetical protein